MTAPEYEEQLEDEQLRFDTAREAHNASFSTDNPKNWTSGTGPDRNAMQRHVDKKVRLSPSEAVAFGRVVLVDGESYLIGKTAISSEAADRLVISWKSKVAEKFYQATVADRNGVAVKRSFQTTGNRVDRFSDTLFEHLSKAIASLSDEIPSDSLLLRTLESSRTGQMQDIVRTIQATQDRLMRTDKDHLLVIQGGPGTGKTAVALHRASWLLYTYRDALPADDMIVVGPNPTFTKYIQQVLPELGDNRVQQTSILELLADDVSVRAVEPDTVAHIKGKADMADVIASGLDDRIKVASSPLRIKFRNSGRTITVEPRLLAPAIEKLRVQPYGSGREQLKELLFDHCAEQLRLLKHQRASEILDPESVDAAVDRMWPRLNGVQFIRELIGSKSRLKTAAEKFLEPAEIDLLFRPAEKRTSDEPWTAADLALIDEANDYMRGDTKTWGHIVVDEAQDLTPMQLLALRRRTRHGSMTLVGDIAQSTGPFARNNWDDIVDALRSRMPATVEELQHGYRVPREVFNVAGRVLEVAAPGLKAPTIVRSANALPELFEVPMPQLPREVAKIASHHSGKGRFVGVVAAKGLWEPIQRAFIEEELKWSDASVGQLGTSINLVTPEESKGLEFDAVVVVDPQGIMDQVNGARLLYIALTRTTSRLDILSPVGDTPQIIRDAFTHVTIIENVEAPVPAASKNTASQQPGTVASGNTGKQLTHEIPGLQTSNMPDESKPLDSSPRSAIELEMIRRNAELLHETILNLYQENVRVEILEVALTLLRQPKILSK